MATKKSKPFWESKTVWVNVLSFIATLNPATAAYLGPHGVAIMAVANVILRLVSDNKQVTVK